MGITPPPTNRVMDVCNVTFDQLKKRIVQQRQRYFLNNPQNQVLVATKKVITYNTRRNPRVIMGENVALATIAHDNYEYLLNENSMLKRELAKVKKHA